jgi:hypothetical protein
VTVAVFFLGVVASMVAWLSVTLLLRPKLRWSDALIRTDFPSGHHTQRSYCAIFRNRRLFRSALSVRVGARMRIQGLTNGAVNAWTTFDIPCDSDFIPRLRPKFHKNGGGPQYSSLRLDEIPDYVLRKFPDGLKQQISSGCCTLEQIFALGSKAELYYTASCIDSLSGVMRIFFSPTFVAVTERRTAVG